MVVVSELGLDTVEDSVGFDTGDRVAVLAGVKSHAAASRTSATASAAKRPSLIPVGEVYDLTGMS